MFGNKALVLILATASLGPAVVDAVTCCISCSALFGGHAECADWGVSPPMWKDELPAVTGTPEDCYDQGFAGYVPEDASAGAGCGTDTGTCESSVCVETGAPPVVDCYPNSDCSGSLSTVAYRRSIRYCLANGYSTVHFFESNECMSVPDGKPVK